MLQAKLGVRTARTVAGGLEAVTLGKQADTLDKADLAFATMTSEMAVSAMSSGFLTHRPNLLIAAVAPDPGDILWQNITVTRCDRMSRGSEGRGWLLAGSETAADTLRQGQLLWWCHGSRLAAQTHPYPRPSSPLPRYSSHNAHSFRPGPRATCGRTSQAECSCSSGSCGRRWSLSSLHSAPTRPRYTTPCTSPPIPRSTSTGQPAAPHAKGPSADALSRGAMKGRWKARLPGGALT